MTRGRCLPDVGETLAPPAWERSDGLLLGAAVALTLALLIPRLTAPGFLHNDEARHALSGVFCRDAVLHLPEVTRDPRGYAVEWYTHYPGLVIPFYYPPFFHSILGIGYLIGGVSLEVARAVVVALAGWTVVFLFLTVRLLAGRRAAAASALILVTIPEVCRWGHAVMLEVPTMAMLITAVYFLVLRVECGRRRAAYGWAIFTCLALLTKQPALFILPASALYLVLRGQWRLALRREGLISLAIVLAVAIPLIFLQIEFARVFMNVSVNGSPWSQRLGATHLLSYPRILGRIAPLAALLAIAGIGVAWRSGRHAAVVLAAAWLTGFLGFQTGITNHTARYAVLAMPALAILASMTVLIPWWRGRVGLAVVSTAVLSQLALLWTHGPDPIAIKGQFATAAETLLHQYNARVVLYEGYHDGEFIFHARQATTDEDRRPFVLRSSKVLYSCATDPNILFADVRRTSDEIYDLLDRTGVTHVVIEEPQRIKADGTNCLRHMVTSPRFQKIATYAIDWPGPRPRSGELNVYSYRRTDGATTGPIVLPIPGIGRELLVSVGEQQRDSDR